MPHHVQFNYKLWDDQVTEMRRLHKVEQWTITRIAKKFKVSRTTASEAINGNYHKHVETKYDKLPNPPNPGNTKRTPEQTEWILSLPQSWSAAKIRKAMIAKYGRERSITERPIAELRRRARNNGKYKTNTHSQS